MKATLQPRIRFYLVSFLTVILLLTNVVAYAQEQLGLRDRAEQAFRKYEYAYAAAL